MLEKNMNLQYSISSLDKKEERNSFSDKFEKFPFPKLDEIPHPDTKEFPLPELDKISHSDKKEFHFPELDKISHSDTKEFPFPKLDETSHPDTKESPFPKPEKATIFISDNAGQITENNELRQIETFSFKFLPEDEKYNRENENHNAKQETQNDDTQKTQNDDQKQVRDDVNIIKIDRNSGDQQENQEKMNNLQPNTIYEFENGDRVETDDKGRVIKSTFTPILVEDKRTPEDNAKTREVGKTGKEGDEGGHIQAHSLGGSSEKINLFPQDANFNRGEYKKIENSIKNDLKEGKDVQVTVELIYDDPNSSRPDRVRVTKIVTDSNGNVEITSVTKQNSPKGEQDA
ncbi:DNA/RNA non-specific endonuclease [Bisgaard Taxon 45]